MTTENNNYNTEINYASVIDRIKSTTIDSIIIIGFIYLLSDILTDMNNTSENLRIILFISILMYEPIFITLNATFGNHRSNIRVRKNKDTTKKLNFFQSLLRFVLKFSLGWISLIFILLNKKGRALYDIVSSSVVITVEES
ncbi:RDD family protein [Flavobacterium sp. J27]|uniref:RDD family protein n=1 Tax=Flavobacterium sp. J27 TaxID=2060419 RepID=UPI00103081B9|nr:RDD family protein [Flavobacterium sp. J27]